MSSQLFWSPYHSICLPCFPLKTVTWSCSTPVFPCWSTFCTMTNLPLRSMLEVTMTLPSSSFLVPSSSPPVNSLSPDTGSSSATLTTSLLWSVMWSLLLMTTLPTGTWAPKSKASQVSWLLFWLDEHLFPEPVEHLLAAGAGPELSVVKAFHWIPRKKGICHRGL